VRLVDHAEVEPVSRRQERRATFASRELATRDEDAFTDERVGRARLDAVDPEQRAQLDLPLPEQRLGRG
jgi:hypothetical protein